MLKDATISVNPREKEYCFPSNSTNNTVRRLHLLQEENAIFMPFCKAANG